MFIRRKGRSDSDLLVCVCFCTNAFRFDESCFVWLAFCLCWQVGTKCVLLFDDYASYVFRKWGLALNFHNMWLDSHS